MQVGIHSLCTLLLLRILGINLLTRRCLFMISYFIAEVVNQLVVIITSDGYNVS